MEADSQSNFVNATPMVMSHSVYYQAVTRLMDIIMSVTLLIFLSPLLIFVSCFIKLTDTKGAVFFVQERIGLNGKSFFMYKFRSMCSNAEEKLEELLELNEAEGAMFKIKEDPRITPIGKYLRKFSIDELPQLFNVLKGDMSLVGPRPCLNREFAVYTETDKQRLLVKPGITGLWQVSGRSSLTFEQMIELDLLYIAELSVVNNLKILVKTLLVVMIPDNSY